MKKSNLFILTGILLFFGFVYFNLFYLIKNNIYRKEDLTLSTFTFTSNIEKLIIDIDSGGTYEIYSSDENKVLVYHKKSVSDDEISFNNNILSVKINGEGKKPDKTTTFVEIYTKHLSEIENTSNSYIVFKDEISKENENLFISSGGHLTLELNKGEVNNLDIRNYGDLLANANELKINEFNLEAGTYYNYSSINFKGGKVSTANLNFSGPNSSDVYLNMPNGILRGKGDTTEGRSVNIYIKGPLNTNDFKVNKNVNLIVK